MSWLSDVKWWEWIIFPIALNHALVNGIKASLRPRVPGLQNQRIQTSEEGLPIPLGYGTVRKGGNVLWRKDPVAYRGADDRIHFAGPMIIGLGEGPIIGIGKLWVESKRYAEGTWEELTGWSCIVGARSQSPWSWLSTTYPDEALGYGGTALLVNSAVQSDSAGNVEAITAEVKFGTAAYSRSGAALDALPSAIITDLLTSTLYAAGWPAGRVASMATGPDGLAASSADRYCHALAFYLSMLVDDQRTVLEAVEEVLGACNLAAFRSGAQIKVVPLGDTEVTRGAYTYTPCTTIRAHFTSADFLCEEDEDPIQVEVRPREEVFNDWPIEYTDRGSDYELRTVSYPDAADIDDVQEQRTAQKLSFPSITDPEHATTLSKILAQQSIHTRRSFSWRVSIRHCRLERIDLVTLSDTRLGLSEFVVRISAIDEEEFQGDKALRFTAEEVVQGVGHAIGYVPQPSAGTATNTAAAPGNANAPVLAQAPAAYAGGKQRLFVVTGGGQDWGGAEVWTSWDNATWSYQGTILRGVHGVLSAILASGSDPDTVNTLAVDLAVSGGQLPTASVAERDALSTLCNVDGEWVSYATSSNPTGTSTNLTSLRRGLWGSTIGAHASASVFARVTAETFRLDIDSARVGSTLRVKLLSFNKWGAATQALADATTYSVVIAAQRAVPAAGNTVDFAQADPPTVRPDGSPLQVGDRWTETDDSNEPHRWNGSNWISLRDGTIADAQADATEALTLAGSKTKVTYAATPPGSPATGEVWFSTDTTTNCPDDNCRGHITNGGPVADVGDYPHRALYWPHRWDGAAWKDAGGQQLTITSELAAGAVVADKVAGNVFQTSDWAQDANGVPTAGARMISASAAPAWSSATTYASAALVSSGGDVYRSLQGSNTNHAPASSPTWWALQPTLQVEPGGLQIGAYVFSRRFEQASVRLTDASFFTETWTFPVEEPDTAYEILATPWRCSSGAIPTVGCFVVVTVVKSTTGAYVQAWEAPATGKWVDWMLTKVRI